MLSKGLEVFLGRGLLAKILSLTEFCLMDGLFHTPVVLALN